MELNILQHGDRSIQVCNQNLQCIPEAVFDKLWIEELDFSHNEISIIDERIILFKQLKKLDLSNNNLNQIPESIFELTNLEVLILSNNQIQDIPDKIIQLQKLKYIKLKGNQLKYLPENIFKLPQLEILDCGFNPINTLPHLSHINKNIEKLDFTSNQFIEFPNQVLFMRGIKDHALLDLERKFKINPRQIEQLSNIANRLKLSIDDKDQLLAARMIISDQTYSGETKHLIPLLCVGYKKFSIQLRKSLIKKTFISIDKDAVFALLGSPHYIPEKVEEGEYYSNSITDRTTHLIVGTGIGTNECKKINSNHQFINEFMFLKQLQNNLAQDKWIVDLEDRIHELLLSEQEENILLALEICTHSDKLNHMCTELLYAYTFINDLEGKNKIRQIFYKNIPEFETIKLPMHNFRFFTSSKSEDKIKKDIQRFTFQTKLWDGIKLSRILFEKHKVAYSFITEFGSSKEQLDFWSAFIKGDVMDLRPLHQLQQLNININLSNIRLLDIRNCHFSRIPELGILQNLPDLEAIDLRNNPIIKIPKTGWRDYAEYQIFLSK